MIMILCKNVTKNLQSLEAEVIEWAKGIVEKIN